MIYGHLRAPAGLSVAFVICPEVVIASLVTLIACDLVHNGQIGGILHKRYVTNLLHQVEIGDSLGLSFLILSDEVLGGRAKYLLLEDFRLAIALNLCEQIPLEVRNQAALVLLQVEL